MSQYVLHGLQNTRARDGGLVDVADPQGDVESLSEVVGERRHHPVYRCRNVGHLAVDRQQNFANAGCHTARVYHSNSVIALAHGARGTHRDLLTPPGILLIVCGNPHATLLEKR